MLTFTIMCPIKMNMIKYQHEKQTIFTTKGTSSANNEETQFYICGKQREIEWTSGVKNRFSIVIMGKTKDDEERSMKIANIGLIWLEFFNHHCNGCELHGKHYSRLLLLKIFFANVTISISWVNLFKVCWIFTL